MITQIAIAVVEHENQFLIGQRPAGVKLAGYYEFPGGKVELHETSAQAAVRECLEETGLKVEVLGEYLQQRFDYAHGPLLLHFFNCRLVNCQQSHPREPFQWIPRHQLADFAFPAGNAQLLALLLSKNELL